VPGGANRADRAAFIKASSSPIFREERAGSLSWPKITDFAGPLTAVNLPVLLSVYLP
jgi:hypothetical protein